MIPARPTERDLGVALELKEIRKSYDGVYALQGANLTCDFGQVHGLIGENGAGKSTLVKVLSGAVPLDDGQIRLVGETISIRSPRDAQRAGIGTVFQELSLIPDLSVAANLLYGRESRQLLGRIDRRAVRLQAASMLEELGVDGLDMTKNVRDLPLADRQVLEIAKVLIRKPRILVLDEATSGLLPEQVNWLFEKVQEFVSSETAVLFVSHRLNEIEEQCDRVTVFRGGVDVGAGGTPDMPQSRLVELMLGRQMDRVFPSRRARQRSSQAEVVCEVDRLSSPPRLRQASFKLRRGEILGIAGLQGQGQAELFLSLFGARRHTGSVRVNGKQLRLGHPSAALAGGLALVPEDRATDGLCLDLPIRDNISIGSFDQIASGGLVSPRREQDLVKTSAQRFKIKMRGPHQEVSALSGGNQQKVLFARVLARDPAVLMLLDATRGIDVGTKAEIYDLMRSLCDKGVAILFYSSDVFELVNLADRVLVLHDGVIRSELVGDDIDETSIVAGIVGAHREEGP